MQDRIKAIWKFLLSVRKRDWGLDDYPLRVIDRGPVEPVGRFKPSRWTVQIINWFHMRGDGDTLEAAFEDLQEQLRRHREEQGSLPRPGMGRELELKFATSEQVDAHYEIIADIVRRVIGMDSGECFVSDESTLWNFHDREDNVEYHKKIAELYGVDVSDIEPPTLVAIARRIRDERPLTRRCTRRRRGKRKRASRTIVSGAAGERRSVSRINNEDHEHELRLRVTAMWSEGAAGRARQV